MPNRALFLAAAGVASVITAQTQGRPVGSGPIRGSAQGQSPPAIASVDPALFRGLKYRLVGPSRGGRVTTVTGVPSRPKTFYMGVASGGLFRTTDGGVSWLPLTDGQVP